MKQPISFILFLLSCKKSAEPPISNTGPDTTSHDFVWRMDTVGWRSTELFDVSIINENNIWVSGYITKEGTDTVYSAAHWTGTEWKLERMKKDVAYTAYVDDAYGLCALNNNDIWLACGSIYHWDGNMARLSWKRDISTTTIAQHLWYHNDHDIWATGTDGLILHYDGAEWHELDSGTTTYSNDVFGAVDPKTGKKTVLAVISARWHREDNLLLSLSNNSAHDTLRWKWPNNKKILYSVWFQWNTPIYIAGNGLVFHSDSSWKVVAELPNYRTVRVRGSAWNNIFVVGVLGFISHYNGSNWHIYNISFDNGEFIGLDVKNDIVVAAGVFNNRGLILTGKKRSEK